MTERTWRIVLVVVALVPTTLAIWAAFAPANFADTIADFGPYNEHFVHDFAAFAATLATGLFIAVRIPQWRTPVLTLAAIWNGYHGVSHVVDIGDAHPHALGPTIAIALAVVTGVLAFLARLSTRSAT
ncbi:MAG TPA: hypothetical protein VJ831_11635 [Jatrophihabitantaceae bacterium]|nr:hypothetical protein [Jatrophihabitantaceae bacterium]